MPLPPNTPSALPVIQRTSCDILSLPTRSDRYAPHGRRPTANQNASVGTTIHCMRGDNPVPVTGSSGIHSEYAQLWRTVVFSHSL